MRKYLFHIKLGLAFLLIVAILVYVYTLRLHTEVEKNTLLVIEETARHDKIAIKSCMDIFFNALAGVKKRLEAGNLENRPTLAAALELESESTIFNKIFLIARSGRIFGGKSNEVGSPEKAQPHFDRLLNFAQTGRLVTRYDDHLEDADINRESLLYAIKLTDSSIAGEQMEAIVGLSEITTQQKYLAPDSFDQKGQAYGFSALIAPSGNYVVGNSGSMFTHEEANFFTQLPSKSTLTKREIQNKMKDAESFHFYMETEKGDRLAYFTPFDSSGQPDWYFIIVVDNGYLERTQATFLLLSMILLGVVILLLFGMMAYGMAARKRLQSAAHTVRERGEILANMSHEIRTPLNGIIGLNYLISKNIDNQGKLPSIKAWLAKSTSLADYLLGMLNEVLDMSRIKAGHFQIAKKRFSISKMMHDLTYMQSHVADQKGVYVVLHQKLSHPYVLGDETHTKQILANILGNAIKFTEKNGSVTINVTQSQTGKEMVLTRYSIKDTGIGISPEFIEKIFDPFAQESKDRAAMPLKGAGLGLPISKQLADAMGATIEIESEPGRGSQFVVSIPTPIAPAEEENTDSAEARKLALAGNHILLAEDAEFNSEFLADVLEDAGFKVTIAVNGQEAVKKFADSPEYEFSIILMDMEMPVLDGCEAAKAIRALDRPDAKSALIFACTANAFQDDKERAIASGMDDFLTKPIDVKQFVARLKEAFPK